MVFYDTIHASKASMTSQSNPSQSKASRPVGASFVPLMAHLCVLTICLLALTPSAWAQTTYSFQYAIGGTINNPYALATDAANNLYVADTGNNRIVKFNSSNSFLGKIGSAGTANGQFSNPTAVAVDNSGNIYVADSSNNRIQKFNNNGTWVWTVGGYGSINGKFQHPTGVAVDSAGNVYVADTNNNRIQKFNSQGTYLSQFGSKGSGNTNFLNPSSVAVDPVTGNIYVLDTGNNALKQFNNAGVWNWTDGGFNAPQGLTIDASTGYVDVSDTNNHVVKQFDSNGNYITQIGSGGNGTAQFAFPYGIAVDNTGKVYVTDFGGSPYYPYPYHNVIWQFDNQGNYLGQFGTPGYTFNNPNGIGVDSNGIISVADSNDHRVMQFNSQGNYVGSFGSFGNGNGQFVTPAGIAIDNGGDVLVTDLGGSPFYPYPTHAQVEKFDNTGNFLGIFGGYGSGNGQFSNPQGIALDSSGNIYIADTSNNRIQEFDSNFNFINKFGSQGTGKGQFQNPAWVAVDSSGNIYVTDYSNNRIQKFTNKGVWIWSVGSYGTGPSQFQKPYGIAVDSASNVYVCDGNNNRVQKFDSTGKFLMQFSADAWGDPYSSHVQAITVDSAGKVYITEGTNSRLVVLAPVTASPTITALSPSQVTAGSGNTTLTVTGTNFVQGSVVNFAGTALATTYVSSTQLTAVVPSSMLTTAGTFNITITNPSNGGTSKAFSFTVVNPVPAIASLSPNQTPAASPDTVVTVTGTGFVPNSTVKFGTVTLATTFVSPTQLTATILAAQLVKAGGFVITVVNGTPGGGTSNAATFTVGTNPLPSITSISPNRANAGSPALLITVTGSNFINGATIKFAGTSLTTALLSSSQAMAVVPANLLTTAGKFAVTLFNPKPGGGNSNSITFAVVNPTPVLNGITPAQATVGSGSVTIALSGSGFTKASTAQFNGTNLATTYISSTQLTAVIPASQLTTAGDDDVTVSNPTPGGGTSASYLFSVLNPTPTLTVLSPNRAAVGSAATTITLTGTNFINGSVVSFGGTNLVTTYVSTTQLTAVIPSNLLTTVGSFDVVVANFGPGGGDTSPLTFTVH